MGGMITLGVFCILGVVGTVLDAVEDQNLKERDPEAWEKKHRYDD